MEDGLTTKDTKRCTLVRLIFSLCRRAAPFVFFVVNNRPSNTSDLLNPLDALDADRLK